MKELKLAVIGKDVSKSGSPSIHEFIAKRLGYKVIYDKISIPEDQFDPNICRIFEQYDGFNVTIPFKLSVIKYLDKVVGDALTFGAVNTVNAKDKTGYNTDGLGFTLMLKCGKVEVKNKKVLVIGAGGAGRSVAKKLLDSGASVFVYDKNTDNAYALEREFKGVKALENLQNTPYYALINASGVGMHRTEGLSPVSEELISLCEVAIDLIYEPEVSKFLEIASSLGKKTMNGRAMLFYQAYYSECIYAGIEPDEVTAEKLFKEYLEEL